MSSVSSNTTSRMITAFESSVYAACSKIPKGKVTTYGALAAAIGNPKACRAVGTALKKNPFAPQVPCHRVVASDLTIGGFQGKKDDITLKRKIDLLIGEGVLFDVDSEHLSSDIAPKRVRINTRSVAKTLKL